jgi:hypothetical protein
MPVRAADLIVRQVGPETVVYDRRRHRAHCLGPLAAAVWRSSESGRSTSEIARRVSAARGEPVDETAVRVALRRLERAGLIEGRTPWPVAASPEAHGAPSGPGRREALRRVAALTGLAVLSVVAPAPAQVAATCIPTGGGQNPCTRSSECCSGCCNAANNKCTGGGTCLPNALQRR